LVVGSEGTGGPPTPGRFSGGPCPWGFFVVYSRAGIRASSHHRERKLLPLDVSEQPSVLVKGKRKREGGNTSKALVIKMNLGGTKKSDNLAGCLPSRSRGDQGRRRGWPRQTLNPQARAGGRNLQTLRSRGREGIFNPGGRGRTLAGVAGNNRPGFFCFFGFSSEVAWRGGIGGTQRNLSNKNWGGRGLFRSFPKGVPARKRKYLAVEPKENTGRVSCVLGTGTQGQPFFGAVGPVGKKEMGILFFLLFGDGIGALNRAPAEKVVGEKKKNEKQIKKRDGRGAGRGGILGADFSILSIPWGKPVSQPFPNP